MGFLRDPDCERCRQNDKTIYVVGVFGICALGFWLLEKGAQDFVQNENWFWFLFQCAMGLFLMSLTVLVVSRWIRRLVICRPGGHSWNGEGYCTKCWTPQEDS